VEITAPPRMLDVGLTVPRAGIAVGTIAPPQGTIVSDLRSFVFTEGLRSLRLRRAEAASQVCVPRVARANVSIVRVAIAVR
jgi:hypothetical protein